MDCLGYCISATGDTAQYRAKFRQQLRGCFWANSRILLNRRAPVGNRLRWWRSLSKGLGDYRFALWPYQPTAVDELESCQHKLLSFVVGPRPRENESMVSFCIRRNREVSNEVIRAKTRIASHLAMKTVTWIEHLMRHPDCPATRLLLEQTPEWLETCRILAGTCPESSSEAGRTMTRAGRGQPIRYLGRWWRVIDFCNLGKDKQLSQERAGWLDTLARRRQ